MGVITTTKNEIKNEADESKETSTYFFGAINLKQSRDVANLEARSSEYEQALAAIGKRPKGPLANGRRGKWQSAGLRGH